MRVDLPLEIVRRTKPLLEDVCQIERTLQQHRASSWLRRFTVLLLPTLGLISRKKAIYANKEKIVAFLHNELALRQQKQDSMRQNRTQIVVNRLQEFASQSAFVEQVLQSKELRGAQAELDVLACLQRLPDTYQIHCDLNLRAHRSIRFAGEYLQTAQIDYFVVGPTGVFVVEVKNWGRQFIAEKTYHDPYEQVGRHSYLCYDLLRTYGEKTRVQSIIVNCGVLPPPAGDDYHAQVVTPTQLLSCLTRHRSQTLDPVAVSQVITTLSGFRQTGNAPPARGSDYPRRRRTGRRRRR